MATLFPRVYRSFQEFESSELSKLDELYYRVDEMVDEMLRAEVEEEKGADDSTMLFDSV
jgi:hypothetical protein